ncbi:hypothetical protein ACQP2U_43735 (plasmid) [Nocardia sp. CA-084685]|uniref:hypothetical protein n=1 Tax=Nocardia sp. CA-084685 TaxID=3239970 RepID=UPI003D96A1CA
MPDTASLLRDAGDLDRLAEAYGEAVRALRDDLAVQAIREGTLSRAEIEQLGNFAYPQVLRELARREIDPELSAPRGPREHHYSRRPKVHDLATQVVASIDAGTLPPGTSLTAEDLVTLYGVRSRTADAALRALHIAGRITDPENETPAEVLPTTPTPDSPLTEQVRAALAELDAHLDTQASRVAEMRAHLG